MLGENPRQPSDTQRMANLDLKARILSGEKIPLNELRAFILAAEADLSDKRTKRNAPEPKAEKPKDVDFF